MTDKIICVTPNAALDRTLVVPDFALGHISRVNRGVVVPGGKGLNMMRAVKILGGHPLSMGLLGGHTGRMVAALAREAGYDAEWTWFEGETRTCTIIADADGVSTVINESGQVGSADWRALADDVCRVAENQRVSTVCFCGSLPEGAPAEAPADVIERLKALGKRVWIDTSGSALSNAIAAKPFAIKVNAEELAAAMNIEVQKRTAVIAAAEALLNDGIQIVVISLGAEGALLFAKDVFLKATPPRIQPVDPIASGDCLHAGIVTALARGESHADAIRSGVAAGTVNALYAGGAQFAYSHYLRVLSETRVENPSR
ncbi:MAG: 1-phosphofructokinase family hexose kinase [Chloroflexota bacterium]|nr:1-phosphofructokinase family hexose kinase [Chloroflexota bacterium]